MGTIPIHSLLEDGMTLVTDHRAQLPRAPQFTVRIRRGKLSVRRQGHKPLVEEMRVNKAPGWRKAVEDQGEVAGCWSALPSACTPVSTAWPRRYGLGRSLAPVSASRADLGQPRRGARALSPQPLSAKRPSDANGREPERPFPLSEVLARMS